MLSATWNRSAGVARFVLLALFTGGLSLVPAAGSTIEWTWQYTAAGINASGTFTTGATHNAAGGYLITGITGARNGVAIRALQPTGTAIPGNSPYTVDNLIFKGPGPQMTSSGFGFALADGTYSNPFYAGFLPTPAYLEFFSMPPFTGGSHTELTVAFTATPVPEPSAGVMVFGALAWATFRVRRRETVRAGRHLP